MAKFLIVSLTLLMSIGANLSEGFLYRLGIDPDILLASLIAFVVTGLIYHRHIALIVLVVLMTVAANVSDTTAATYGYSPDFMLAGLIALVLAPFFSEHVLGFSYA